MSNRPLNLLLSELLALDQPDILTAYTVIKAYVERPTALEVAKTDDETRDENCAKVASWVKRQGEKLNWSHWVLAASFHTDQGGADRFKARMVGDLIAEWKQSSQRPTNITKTLEMLADKELIAFEEVEGKQYTYWMTPKGRKEALRMISSDL